MIVYLFGILFCMEMKAADMEKMEAKIVGGYPIAIEEFPSAVKIFNNGNLCAGSIINSYSILTAAHCFDNNMDKSEISVAAGSRHIYDENIRTYDVAEIRVHEDYNKEMLFACDIAMVFLETAIEFNNKSKKAILVNTNAWMNENEKSFEATGWGMTTYHGSISDLGLLMTELHYVSKTRCEALHKMKFTKDMFCLYGGGTKDTCMGDSGGGILWKGMVVGIVSHGEGCAKKGKPSLYTNVYCFIEWIEQAINKFRTHYCKRPPTA